MHEWTAGGPDGAWACGDGADSRAPDGGAMLADGGGGRRAPVRRAHMAPHPADERPLIEAFASLFAPLRANAA